MRKKKFAYRFKVFLNRLQSPNGPLHKLLHGPFLLSILATLTILLDLGFEHSRQYGRIANLIYDITLLAEFLSMVFRYSVARHRPGRKVWLFDGLLCLAILLVLYNRMLTPFSGFFADLRVLNSLLIAVFLREFSTVSLSYGGKFLNPARLFILSFALIILFGTFLLMLPNATVNGISFVDALFTATSAVCVTGLIVVDTATYFTGFGKSLILILIQIGGLGIMTFTSYFTYFFKGDSSYENQLLLKEITNADRIADVFETLKKIILVTLIIELAGMIIIYFTVEATMFEHRADRFFFAIFHSISAFCNAGFSTLSDGLYAMPIRFNYSMQLVIAFLVIIGGMGFPIIFNSMQFLRYYVLSGRNARTLRILKHKPWVLNINTRIVITSTLILLFTGTVLFFVFEHSNALKDHSWQGKIVASFFGAVTPRTAGFNTVDMSTLMFPTTMLFLLLMWIGASPGSTGGGIKTTTVAVAILNYFSLARGKEKIEIYGREIGSLTIRRAFAIISLSLLVIGMSVFLLTIFEGDYHLLKIAFECFSAYSTVGLTLGITPNLTEPSKVVIVITMFIGRVGMLTMLTALFRKVLYHNYRLPEEELTIN